MGLDELQKFNRRGAETQRQRVTGHAILLLMFILLSFLPACKKEIVKTEEEAIKEAIVKFDKALVDVYWKLDPKLLAGLASEREIGKNADIVVGYINKKVYLDS